MKERKYATILRELSLNDIRKSISLARKTKSGDYFDVYLQMLNFVKKCRPNSMEDFIGITHMVYGWMPTILHLKLIKTDYKKLFNKIHNNKLTREDLLELKGMINNSMVGVSKFCHFVNPESYAIWDSRVCSKVITKKAYEYIVNNVDNFIAYNNRLNELKNENMDYLIKELGEKVKLSGKETRLRILELGLFIR